MSMTMQEACEVIERAKILTYPNGTHPTAEQIFHYSPTGELFMIWEWYAVAKAKLAETP